MGVDIRKPLKKYAPILIKAQEDNLNEADTVQRIVKVLEDVLGYDAFDEITRETAIKDKYCDLAIKIDGNIRLLIEAKSASTVLRERHIDQAQGYAAHANIPWVLLSNGVQWTLFHLTFEDGIEPTCAFTCDILEDLDKAAEMLALLHRTSLIKGDLDEYWQHRSALGAGSLGAVLFSESVLMLIRREIRKKERLLIDIEDLGAALHSCLSTEAREQIGPFKIRKRRMRRVKAAGQTCEAQSAEAQATEGPTSPVELSEEATDQLIAT